MKREYYFVILLFMLLACQSATEHSDHIGNRDSTQTESNDTVFIAIQPFTGMDTAFCTLAKREIEAFYTVTAEVLKPIDLPAIAYYKPRNRYRADTLIDFLYVIKPKKYLSVIGLTHRDISVTKGEYPDWGVLGLGFMPGNACIVSTFRLKRNVSVEKLRERFAKVILHELGHNFGLDHCTSPKCLMRDAEGTVKSVDEEEKSLCPECKMKLSNILKR
ncbi:MAG: Zn-dependent protease [Bacteroidetes bacterium]|nr:Zn-dependent protease [Bacteroidota bacterium]